MEKKKRIRGHCIDCGTGVAGNDAKRCRSCNTKNRTIHESRTECQREWHLKKKYGIDNNDFEMYWIAFRGECGICGKLMKRPTLTRGQGLDTVTVDHCHRTGKVRGLLCSACNKGLGMFGDDTHKLRGAIEWLLKNQD